MNLALADTEASIVALMAFHFREAKCELPRQATLAELIERWAFVWYPESEDANAIAGKILARARELRRATDDAERLFTL